MVEHLLLGTTVTPSAQLATTACAELTAPGGSSFRQFNCMVTCGHAAPERRMVSFFFFVRGKIL